MVQIGVQLPPLYRKFVLLFILKPAVLIVNLRRIHFAGYFVKLNRWSGCLAFIERGTIIYCALCTHSSLSSFDPKKYISLAK